MKSMISGVPISKPDKLLYPAVPFTKLQLARFYEELAPWMLPHVVGRPLTLVRCGDGVDGRCAFMRHGRAWGPTPLRRVSIREKTKVGEYLVIENAAGLVS